MRHLWLRTHLCSSLTVIGWLASGSIVLAQTADPDPNPAPPARAVLVTTQWNLETIETRINDGKPVTVTLGLATAAEGDGTANPSIRHVLGNECISS